MKRTSVEDMRDKDREQNSGGLIEKFSKQTRARQEEDLLGHFTARAFKQQAESKQHYTIKRLNQASFTSSSPSR